MTHQLDRADLERAFIRYREITGDVHATLDREGAMYTLQSQLWEPLPWYGKAAAFNAITAFTAGWQAAPRTARCCE